MDQRITKKFLFETFALQPNDIFHLARTSIDHHEDLIMHYHDYYEFFVISEGEGIHIINNEEFPIQKGTAYFIRPSDVHTFKKTSKEELVINNLAIKAHCIPHYQQRYFEAPEQFFWNDTPLPFSYNFNESQLQTLLGHLEQMSISENSLLTLDLLLLHLFALLQKRAYQNGQLPPWLNYTLQEFRSPYYLKMGIDGFIQLSQRSGDYINRVIKKAFKKTLTELILEERLNFAAHQLAMTNAPIKSIYTNAGFENHSYFFRVFKKKFGVTPLQYRNKNHKVV
ncbi:MULTISPECIES: helix-turn-helix domain-containing protein [unclassified Flammeovirga]|uniref:helix-turn-helix domain-containing protein n=1 Tax=unclassified Flammeovirga TaxID=2637820 RepID=UPI0005C564BB|nr:MULTISPECIES: helix-turn-helix domain-containing protein [unclassified Flammeovirga]MBD0399976.1 helix-turn-helix domain-containing protein [Flammeovirga sp. EKP202]